MSFNFSEIKAPYLNILLLLGSLCVCLLAGELAVRVIGHSDIDGNFFIGDQKLKPYYLPEHAMGIKLDKYFSSAAHSIEYDPLLGWSPQPKSRSKNRLHFYNKDGIRTQTIDDIISRTPNPGTLRIAILGSSYVESYEVPFQESWGYFLENSLRKAGIPAEVLNFGVRAYGQDQAFLRWKELVYKFSPHIVIFGFQPDNLAMNLSLIPPLTSPGIETPLLKPRYILESGKLKLINSPTPLPEEILSIIKNMPAWSLGKYQYGFNAPDYEKKLWLNSKLIAFILSFFDKHPQDQNFNPGFYALNQESAILGIKIIEEFRRDVESHGTLFYIVHLPGRRGLKQICHQKPLPYKDLLNKIDTIAPVIHTENEMLKAIQQSTLQKICPQHYSAEGNKVIAATIQQFLTNHWETIKQQTINKPYHVTP